MKKSSFVLFLVLYVGIVSGGLIQSGCAQPAQLSYSQALLLTKQDLDGKNYEVAEKDAQKLLDASHTTDETSQALMALGETFYLRKMYEPAQEQWSKILDLPADKALPEDKEDEQLTLHQLAHLNLARSYTAQGRFDEAIARYKAGLPLFDHVDEKTRDGDAQVPKTPGEKSDEENSKAWGTLFSLALANAYYHTKQYDLAQQQLEQVIESTPQDMPAILLIALTRSSEIDFVQFRLKKSVAGFKQVSELALKENAPLTQKYAQDQAQWANLLIQTNWEGGGTGNLKIDLRKDPSDLRMNTIIQGLNDVFLDDLVVGTLSTTDD